MSCKLYCLIDLSNLSTYHTLKTNTSTITLTLTNIYVMSASDPTAEQLTKLWESLVSLDDRFSGFLAYQTGRYIVNSANFSKIAPMARALCHYYYSRGQRRFQYEDHGLAQANSAVEALKEARDLSSLLLSSEQEAREYMEDEKRKYVMHKTWCAHYLQKRGPGVSEPALQPVSLFQTV